MICKLMENDGINGNWLKNLNSLNKEAKTSKKTKMTFFPTLLHDHAASQLEKIFCLNFNFQGAWITRQLSRIITVGVISLTNMIVRLEFSIDQKIFAKWPALSFLCNRVFLCLAHAFFVSSFEVILNNNLFFLVKRSREEV